MSIKIGDLLVFVGNEGLENSHYDSFQIGKQYEVSRVERIGYDLDEVSGYSSDCVLFKDHSHGCLLSSVKSYFVRLEDYRDTKIEKIIG